MSDSPQDSQPLEQPLEKRGGTEMIAEMTKAVLNERGWSLRQAEIQTGVGYSTIQQMQRGFAVKPESLQTFARAVGQDPDVWVIIAATRNPARHMSEPDISRLPAIVQAEFHDTQKELWRSENIRVPIMGRVAADIEAQMRAHSPYEFLTKKR